MTVTGDRGSIKEPECIAGEEGWDMDREADREGDGDDDGR